MIMKPLVQFMSFLNPYTKAGKKYCKPSMLVVARILYQIEIVQLQSNFLRIEDVILENYPSSYKVSKSVQFQQVGQICCF